jgi:hypothetical protein
LRTLRDDQEAQEGRAHLQKPPTGQEQEWEVWGEGLEACLQQCQLQQQRWEREVCFQQNLLLHQSLEAWRPQWTLSQLSWDQEQWQEQKGWEGRMGRMCLLQSLQALQVLEA